MDNLTTYAIAVTRPDMPDTWLTDAGTYTPEVSEANRVGPDRLGEFVALSVELTDSFPGSTYEVVQV